mmetsp:Transcript_44870/g.116238  ORF Transcript_44870/g.116238 Transcript_44870/m.116238 type:complete len:279 (+) Transcript_44870:931-1767(+)
MTRERRWSNSRSCSIREMTAHCIASFCPNTATSASHTLKSLRHTVATPVKKCGRAASSLLPCTNVGTTTVPPGEPCGYISSGCGAKTAETPRSDSSWRSRSNVRGYLSKSSWAANCAGFTKIVARTSSACFFASSMSSRCPECRLPMVGTSPTLPTVRRQADNSARVRSNCTVPGLGLDDIARAYWSLGSGENVPAVISKEGVGTGHDAIGWPRNCCGMLARDFPVTGAGASFAGSSGCGSGHLSCSGKRPFSFSSSSATSLLEWRSPGKTPSRTSAA